MWFRISGTVRTFVGHGTRGSSDCSCDGCLTLKIRGRGRGGFPPENEVFLKSLWADVLLRSSSSAFLPPLNSDDSWLGNKESMNTTRPHQTRVRVKVRVRVRVRARVRVRVRVRIRVRVRVRIRVRVGVRVRVKVKVRVRVRVRARLLTSVNTHIGIGLHGMTLLDARDDDARVLLPAAANVNFGSGLSVELLLDARGYL